MGWLPDYPDFRDHTVEPDQRARDRFGSLVLLWLQGWRR
jgi:hypothetical protein